MIRFSLRTQVIAIVTVLTIGAIGSIVMTANAVTSARESIVRLNLDRLRSVTAELARRQGSVIGFIAEEQFADSAVAQRPELLNVLAGITREELQDYPDASAGFYHSLWNSELGPARTSGSDNPHPVIQRFLRALTQNTVDQQHEQSGHYETGETNYIVSTTPVYAKGRFVGVAWAVDDLSNDIEGAWRSGLTPLLQIAVLVGILLAALSVLNLRRDVQGIQTGLDAMKEDLSHRLPTPKTELGVISASINRLAETVFSQQQDKERLQKQIDQKEKLAALGQLTAGVAHEIRTPLSLIKTRVQLWQRSPRPRGRSAAKKVAVTAESMHMVVDELDRLEEIVRKLLYFSKQRTLRLRKLDMHEFLTTTLNVLQGEFRKKRVRVVKDFGAEHASVNGDPSELREVFLNLLSNSIDALPSAGTVTIRTRLQAGDFCIAIEDTGKGIPKNHVPNIFDPFFTTKETGIGLGLSIAREIVQSHNGRLEYTTSHQGGARFEVMLPA